MQAVALAKMWLKTPYARSSSSHCSSPPFPFPSHPPYWMSKLSVTVLFSRQTRHRLCCDWPLRHSNVSVYLLRQCHLELCHENGVGQHGSRWELKYMLNIFRYAQDTCLHDLPTAVGCLLTNTAKLRTRQRWSSFSTAHISADLIASDIVFTAEYKTLEPIITSLSCTGGLAVQCEVPAMVWKSNWKMVNWKFKYDDCNYDELESRSSRLRPLFKLRIIGHTMTQCNWTIIKDCHCCHIC